jgi:hypothetical protein
MILKKKGEDSSVWHMVFQITNCYFAAVLAGSVNKYPWCPVPHSDGCASRGLNKEFQFRTGR